MSARKAPKLLIIVVVLAVLAVGGYAALWFTQANVAKNQLTNSIARINALDTKSEILSYESITTEGFPKSLVLRVHRPILNIPMRDILKPMGQGMPPAPDGTDQAEMRKALLELPEWVETITLNGNIAFTVNAQSNSYRIEPIGDYQVESKINNKDLSYTVAFEKGARGCDFNFNRSSSNNNVFKLWNWDYLSGDIETAMDALQKLECHAPPLKVFVSDATEASYASSPLTFLYENNGNGDTLDINAKLVTEQYIATADFDQLMTHYFQGMYPDQALPEQYRMAALGKQKLVFDASILMNKKVPESAPVKITLRDFTYQSDISESHNSLNVESGALSQGGKVSWNFKSDTNFKEAAYQNYLAQAKEYATTMYNSINAMDTDRIRMDEASFITQYQSIVPKLHELGNINIAFAGNGELKNGMGMPLELKNLALNLTPYGIEAKGKGEIPSAFAPVPTGDYQLSCRSCLILVDDATAWFQRFQPLLKEADPASAWASLNLTPEAVEGLKSFLQKLAPDSTDTLQYNITLGQAGDVIINEKPMQEVMALYDQEVGSLLNKEKSSDAASDEKSDKKNDKVASAEKAKLTEPAPPIAAPVPQATPPVPVAAPATPSVAAPTTTPAIAPPSAPLAPPVLAPASTNTAPAPTL